MASFDIVSEVDLQEVDNAINQSSKEVEHRYDLRGSKAALGWDSTKLQISLTADGEQHLTALYDILTSKLFKRGIELGSLEVGKMQAAGGSTQKQLLQIKQGLETDKAKEICALIREWKLKVDVAIQQKQIRVTGKKIDDLQEVIARLKQNQEKLKVPLQFLNMRS